MNIGIDISQIVYQTGVSRYTVELLKHLLVIDQKNHYFLYAGSLRQKPIIKSFIKQIKTDKVTSKISNLSPKLADIFWNQLNLPAPNISKKLDVFHSSNWAIPKTKTNLVTTIHDLTFLKYPKSHLPYYTKAHIRHLDRSKEFSKIIITDSLSTKKDLVNYGINESKIRVVHLASSSIFKPVKDLNTINQVLDKYNLRKPFILSVGTNEPRKNLKRLIQAYQALNLKKTKLVLVGKFGWGEKLQKTKGIKLLGFVPDQDLKVLYSTAKVFVYPSLYEGFGFPILEALSCGCPVITSNVSSLPEVGGQAALYINPRSVSSISKAINTILKISPPGYQSLVKASLNQAKKFSWTKTAKETLKVYQEATTC